MNRKYVLYFYFFLLHIIIFILSLECDLLNKISEGVSSSSSELKYSQKLTHAFNLRVDKNTSQGKVIFLGDSHIQGLAVNEVSNQGINFGIGRDTSKTILNRMQQYQSIKSAKAVVLAFGINDFQYRSIEETLRNYKAILEEIPKTTLIVINAVFYVDTFSTSINIKNKSVAIFNQKLEQLSKEYSNSIFMNVNPKLTYGKELLTKYHVGDGLHLNKVGYQVWINELRKIITKEVR